MDKGVGDGVFRNTRFCLSDHCYLCRLADCTEFSGKRQESRWIAVMLVIPVADLIAWYFLGPSGK